MGAILYTVLLFWPCCGSRDVASFPPSPVDEKLLAVAPRDCLFFAYWAASGEPQANSSNRTERLLAEKEVRDLYAGEAQLARLWLNNELSEEPKGLLMLPDEKEQAKQQDRNPTATDPPPRPITEALELFYRCPTATYLGPILVHEAHGEIEFDGASAAIVLNIAKQRDRARRLLDLVLSHPTTSAPRAPEPYDFQKTRIGDCDALVCPNQGTDAFYLLIHGDYLIATMGKRALDDTLDGLDGRRGASDWLTRIRQRAPTERLATLRHYNIGKVFEFALRVFDNSVTEAVARKLAEPLGIENLISLSSISGLEDPGIVQRTIVETRGTPRGLFAGVADRPLTIEDFKLIPKNVDSALVGRFDFARVSDEYDRLTAVLAAHGDAEWSASWAVARAKIENEFDLDFAKDAGALGSRCCFFDYGGKHGDVTILEIRARARAAKVVAKLRAAAETRGTTFVDTEIAGTRVSGTKKGDFCWALLDDRIVICSEIRILERYLSRPADAENLAANEQIQRSLAGPNAPSIFCYQAHDAVGFDKTYELIEEGVDKLSTAVFWQQGVILPKKLIPSRYSIERHLTWSSYAVRRTDYGLLSETRCVLPCFEMKLAATLLKGIGGEKPDNLPALLSPFVPGLSPSVEQAPSDGPAQSPPIFIPTP